MNNWTGIAIVIFGYAVGLYFQNKRLDDFKEGLYKYLDEKFKSIDSKFSELEKKIETEMKIHELEHHKK